MSDFIILNNEPTKQEIFRSKLYGIPFLIDDLMDVINFNLLDCDRLCEMNISTSYRARHKSNNIRIHDIKLKHNVDVYVSFSNSPKKWKIDKIGYPIHILEKKYPEILNRLLTRINL